MTPTPESTLKQRWR